jgi:hypothetical protein
MIFCIVDLYACVAVYATVQKLPWRGEKTARIIATEAAHGGR